MGGAYVIPDRDSSNRPVNKLAMTEKGWKFLSHVVTITTGKETDSVRMKNFKGDDRCPFAVTHYKDSGTLVTDYVADLANINETRVTIMPPHDYDILKGTVYNHAISTGRCEVGVGIGSFLPPSYDITQVEMPPSSGNYVDLFSEFIGGLDLEHFDGNVHIDGESSKMINKDIGYGVDMNVIQVRIYHAAGLQHTFMCSLEYYRA